MLLGYAESISVARGFASDHRYEVRPNQELVPLGASNALAGLFQGFVAAGGASQSAASDRAGAKTELFAVVAAALTIILLLQRISRPHSAVLGRLPDESGYGDVERHPEAETVPGLLVFRLDAPLFFANVQVLRGRIRTLVSEASPPVRLVLLDTEATSGLDIEGVDALGELRAELEQGGAELWLARVRAPVRSMLERAGLARSIGEGKIHPSVHAGVQAYLKVNRT